MTACKWVAARRSLAKDSYSPKEPQDADGPVGQAPAAIDPGGRPVDAAYLSLEVAGRAAKANQEQLRERSKVSNLGVDWQTELPVQDERPGSDLGEPR